MANDSAQPGILAAVPAFGRALTFRVAPEADLRAALRRLRDGFEPEWGVVGVGEPVVLALGPTVKGLRVFPGLAGPGCSIPSTQQGLWCFLRGQDRSALFDLTEALQTALISAFVLDDAMDTFTYAGGRDLAGYEDGTENPRGDAAAAAAAVQAGDHMKGSSFVAVQRWVHDLGRRARTGPGVHRLRGIAGAF